MSKVVSVTLSDSMYECARERAAFEGRANKSNPGISGLIKSALRFYLNKNGYKTSVIDGDIHVEKTDD
jgi:hypothetical protein